MSTFKERIEQNLVVWLLSMLLTGFLAGFGAYKTIQEIGGLTPVSKTTIDTLQKKAGALEASLAQADRREDSLRAGYEAEIKTLRQREKSVAKSAVRAYSGVKNCRVHVIHAPSQAQAAAVLAGLIEKKGAIVTTSSLSYDRSYWCISSREHSDRALIAATQIKSLFTGLEQLPLRQTTSETGINDVVIWLHAEYR